VKNGHRQSLLLGLGRAICDDCFGRSLVGRKGLKRKGSHWLSREIALAGERVTFGCRRSGGSGSRERAAGNRVESIRRDASDEQESGRPRATAAELFGAGKLVLGTDDGNVEGDKSAPAFVNGLKRSAWLLVRPPPGLHACVQPGE